MMFRVIDEPIPVRAPGRSLDRSLKIAIGSFIVSASVFAIKYIAYVITGSVALYSDAIESIINITTAAAVIIAVKIAANPPDAEHPYGHHKAEYLSAVVVGVMIVAAAIAIMKEAYGGFVSPKPIESAGPGLTVSIIATAFNLSWSLFLIRQGRIHKSVSLVADGKHLMADVATSVGVLVGVVLVVVTGIIELDAVIAALVALHVLWSGWGVIRESTSGLLDESAPAEDVAEIKEAIARNADGAIEARGLRTRHAGKALFVEFQLVVPAEMSTGRAHEICDRIEAGIKDRFEGAMTTIHVEPEERATHDNAAVQSE
jgi:cation diffusion facilitator family transporter